MSVLDPKDTPAYYSVRGTVTDISAEGGRESIERLSQKYTGGPYRNYGGSDTETPPCSPSRPTASFTSPGTVTPHRVHPIRERTVMEHDPPQDGPPPAEVAGYAYLPPDSPAYWQSGTYWRLLSSAEQTAGRSCTFDELCPPGLVAPPHVHDAEEEAFFVLEGNLVFTLEDKEIQAPPGTYVYIPPGTRGIRFAASQKSAASTTCWPPAASTTASPAGEHRHPPSTCPRRAPPPWPSGGSLTASGHGRPGKSTPSGARRTASAVPTARTPAPAASTHDLRRAAEPSRQADPARTATPARDRSWTPHAAERPHAAESPAMASGSPSGPPHVVPARRPVRTSISLVVPGPTVTRSLELRPRKHGSPAGHFFRMSACSPSGASTGLPGAQR